MRNSSKQLGIILSDLISSQIYYYALRNAYKAISDGLLEDVTLFFINKSQLMCPPRLSLCHVANLAGFKGNVIATCIPSMLKLLKCPVEGQKFYYMFNMEWLLGGVVDANQLFRLYRQENVAYIARNDFHASLIKNNFNRPPDLIMENFELEHYYKYINEQ